MNREEPIIDADLDQASPHEKWKPITDTEPYGTIAPPLLIENLLDRQWIIIGVSGGQQMYTTAK